MVRKSARSRKETRYAVNDVYKDLDSDTAPAPEGDEDNVSSSDDDFRIPDAGEAGEKTGGGDEGEEEEEDDSEGVVSEEEEESEEESDDDVVGGGEDDESDDDDDRPRRPKSKGSAVGASAGKNKAPGATTSFRARQRREDETPGSAPSVHKKHVRTVTSGKLVGRKKMIAEGASASELKVPDPAIRITYRPGISKATGKKDRIMQVYGGADDAHEKAMRARNMWMDLPTLPERGGEASPFLEGREGGEEEPRLGEGGQVSRPLEFESVAAYMAKVAEPLKLVVGHVGAYEKVTFKRFEIYDLRKVAEDKRGFLVNAGAQVLSMDWATNRPEGCQYLALSTLTEGETTGEIDPEVSPAFGRTPSKSSVQIWRFPVDETTNSPTNSPSVALMLCHDWGPAKNLKWCPLKESFPDPKTLGYLAGIFADGNVHIIKVELPTEFDSTSSDSDGTDFLYIPSAAYTIHLPLDIITALSWISHTSLVVGCATGHIAAWDLDADITAPYLYMPLHQTYISGLNSCWPSFPNHIVTSSMDGYSRLTSLLAPISDSIPNNRSRIAPCAMTYIDTIQAGVSIEEGTWVKFFPLRRYFSSTTVCKHGGIVRALSASVLHPFLLTGGTEGEAMFSNPLRRVFHGKIKNFQQTWFQLEYSNETNMLRMTEGFKLEECEGKAKVKGGQQLLTTVFPEQVGIGALGWNPNVRFGGWAAAAASCGLVRVEDVAIDP